MWGPAQKLNLISLAVWQTNRQANYIYIYKVDQKSWRIELGPNVLENDFWLNLQNNICAK